MIADPMAALREAAIRAAYTALRDPGAHCSCDTKAPVSTAMPCEPCMERLVAAVLRVVDEGKNEGPYTIYPAWVMAGAVTACGAMVLDGKHVLWNSWTDARDGTPQQQAERSTARARAVCNALNRVALTGAGRGGGED